MHGQQLMAALLVAAGLTAMPAPTLAQVIEDQQLAKMAAVAESPEQHARVADAYRDHASRLEREATRLAKKARQLERGWSPHEYKAAPMHRAGYTERQDAARARQQARAMRGLAEHHARTSLQLRNAPE